VTAEPPSATAWPGPRSRASCMSSSAEGATLADLGIAITGGLGDIGLAMAIELAGRGAHVSLIDRVPEETAAPRLAEVTAAGTCSYHAADVTDRAAVEGVVAAIDPLDVVISNAGIVLPAPFLEVTAHEWQQQLDVNLTGCFNVGQAAARGMVARRRPGKIIFTGSWVGDVPWPDISAYSVTKAGIRMLAKSMARELAPHGIRVNVIAPGIVFAGMARQQYESDALYARRAATAIPLGEFGTAEQIAKATAFLCSPDSDYMTGSVLLVDGGASLFNLA
jgi:NAD(P)-dependent dehydrogenase (short-subunit alcohol dehydrogenase family)